MAVITGGNSILPSTETGSAIIPSLISRTAYGTDGESDLISGCDKFTALNLQVKITEIAGTSPTINVYLQSRAPDGSTFYDIASMAQITANGSYMLCIKSNTGANFTLIDGSLAAGTIRTVPFASVMRVKLDFGGTNPSCTILVAAEFIR